MLLTFGKHQGSTVAEIVLKESDYLIWMLGQQNPTGPMAQACAEARRLIAIFDDKPFLHQCMGHDCDAQATRITVYGQNIQPVYWCDACDPYSMGAASGKIQAIKRYCDAVQHVSFWCQGRKSDLKELIRSMARAKGLPARVGVQQAEAFFQH